MTHQMQIKQTYSTGAELWVCPDCARRLIMQWEPLKRIVLSEGRESVAHRGIKGGLPLEIEKPEIKVDEAECWQ